MILKIGNRVIERYNQAAITLNYDSVASTFAFSLFFDPENSEHRQMFRPLQYQDVTIEHNGELLITGTMLTNGFKDGAESNLVEVAGYSKCGLIEDCGIPLSAYPLQTNSLTLRQICERVLKPFNLSVIVDTSVAQKVDSRYNQSTAKDDQSIKDYIDSLARQKYVVMTHDERGNLVLTEAKAKQSPIWDFGNPGSWTSMSLDIDGQQMHSEITYKKQATKRGKGNAGQASISNPYCKVFRPKTDIQTSGKNIDTKFVARNGLSEELKSIQLEIEVDSWSLGGKLIRPNTIVTVLNPDCYIYSKTRWFIRSVEFSGDENSTDTNDGTAKITCCLPEVFTSDMPVNIFES